jgi:hypothetical protein
LMVDEMSWQYHVKAESESEFYALIKDVFRSPWVKAIIQSTIAISNEARLGNAGVQIVDLDEKAKNELRDIAEDLNTPDGGNAVDGGDPAEGGA